jgi:hypothetical protein
MSGFRSVVETAGSLIKHKNVVNASGKSFHIV